MVRRSCIIDCTFKSEYSNEYKKTPYKSYKEHYEVPVPCSRFIFPRELCERGNQLLPRHSKINSTYRNDYQPGDQTIRRPQLSDILYSKPDHQYGDVDVKHCGYEKYLDIYATTKVLDHRQFTPRELQHDAITLWDWIKIPKVRGRTVPLDVPIGKRDLDTMAKINQPKPNDFVPNRGLVTEYQVEFTYKRLARPN